MNVILADTSIWIDHFKASQPALVRLLEREQIVMHPCVVGELACGNLKQRKRILQLLAELTQVTPATDEEVLHMIARHDLAGRGLGWIDMHLLAACLVSDAHLWTRDRRLHEAAEQLDCAWYP